MLKPENVGLGSPDVVLQRIKCADVWRGLVVTLGAKGVVVELVELVVVVAWVAVAWLVKGHDVATLVNDFVVPLWLSHGSRCPLRLGPNAGAFGD